MIILLPYHALVNQEAHMCWAGLDFSTVVHRKAERTEQIFQRFDDMFDKAIATAGFGTECIFRLWLVLSLLRFKLPKFVEVLKDNVHRLPENAQEHRTLQQSRLRGGFWKSRCGSCAPTLGPGVGRSIFILQPRQSHSCCMNAWAGRPKAMASQHVQQHRCTRLLEFVVLYCTALKVRCSTVVALTSVQSAVAVNHGQASICTACGRSARRSGKG